MALDITPKQEGGKLKAVASGTLPSGQPVVVNSDGTVSVPVSPFSSPVVFESGGIVYPSPVYDTNSNKVVIAYRDGGNSNYGTAVVGTVSGGSITFGTPVVFESANSIYISAVFDNNSNKVVIAYYDGGNGGYGTSIVGTVSGNSISFGTPVVFESASSVYISSVFDSGSNKVVIAYRDGGNSNYGTAIVGTVSGTSISFGSAVVFNTAGVVDTTLSYDSNLQKVVLAYRDQNTNQGTARVGTVTGGTSISFGSAVVFDTDVTSFTKSVYDVNAQKVVIAYRDGGNSNYGTAIVGTVSGTNISFGSSVVFQTSRVDEMAIGYDANLQKVVLAYQNVGNSSYGTSVVGTVSGTSISFGSSVVFNAASTTYTSVLYDPDSTKVLIAYPDGGNSSAGTSLLFTPDGASVVLTSENYIGISTGGTYAAGSSATVDIIGTLNEDQSGLTAGQSYYVQTDGTLNTTPADPSVFAGTAISATSLVVKT